MNEQDKYLNLPGAMALAKKLESYWHQRGYKKVRFFASPTGFRDDKIGTYEIYQVRQNFLGTQPTEQYR